MNAASRVNRLLRVPEQHSALVALETTVIDRRADLQWDGSPDPSGMAQKSRPTNGRPIKDVREDTDTAFDIDLVFLHGPAGCGKTHLVQWVLDNFASPEFTIQIIAADANFTSERSPRGGSKPVEPDDEPDLLIVEDLQFLSPNSVEPLIARLESRQTHRLLTVVTASAGPRHLRFRGKPYPARLTSRLAAGLVVPIAAPQAGSRRTVLETLIADIGLNVPEGVVDHLANHGRGLRALEGSVNQLKLLAGLEPGPLKAGPLLDHFQKQSVPEPVSVERIVQRVANYFEVAVKDVRSRSRRRGFVVPRHVSMYLARRLTPMSLQQIGAYFGGCDHATVMHACRKMEQTLESDPELGGAVRQLHDDLA